MKIEILIDKLTPCLVEIATGKVLQTTFSVAKPEDLKNLQMKGWNFDWTGKDLSYSNIYKLQIKDDDEIQGLVAAEAVRGAVYMRLAESAPHNLGKSKKYDGVGGHLFAIAMKLSVAMGHHGYIYFEAKNEELAEHYTKNFGAQRLRARIHDYRMEIEVNEAQEVIEKYTLEGDLDVR